MTVAELIRELQKMPQDKKVIMFDGPTYYTPSSCTFIDKTDKSYGYPYRDKVLLD